MTKFLIIIAIAAVAFLIGSQIFKVWQRTSTPGGDAAADSPAAVTAVGGADGAALPGLPPGYEETLQAAQRQGAEALGAWLKRFGPTVQDPRLAWIELDYVVLLNLKDPIEARKQFQKVKQRVTPDSPVHARVKALEKTYE